MPRGLFAMRDEALNEAYKRAMMAGAYATAERIAYELNEPGMEYVYRHRPPLGLSCFYAKDAPKINMDAS